MDARSVGLRLGELVRANQDATAVEELYDENIVSIEIMSDPEAGPQMGEGIQTIYEKHAWWESVATVHNIDIEGPFAGNGDDHFVVRFQMDVTMEGQRSQMTEAGLHTVANGKIIKEVYLDLVSQ